MFSLFFWSHQNWSLSPISSCPQPSIKFRLPFDPGGFARTSAAYWSPTGHRRLRLWPQSTHHPPVTGLRHPEACAWHSPIRAQCQWALCYLQRLLTGKDGGRRLCDSSSQVIDGGAACQPHLRETQSYRGTGRTPPPRAHLLGASSHLCCLLFLECRAQPRMRLQQTTRGLLA